MEIPIDVIRLKNGSLKVITDYDMELFRKGLIKDPYDV